MLQILKQRWFLISLLFLIAAGLAVGSQLPADRVASLRSFVSPRAVTAFVLFLMAFSLETRRLLRTSFRAPGPVVWAFLVNYGAIPLMAIALLPVQQTADFRYGLMIAASVPCTMAAASVWTRRAGGNDAVSLLVTVSTNGLCFLITPFWLDRVASQSVRLDLWAMVLRLVSAVLIPAVIGQLARLIPRAARFADERKTVIGVAAQIGILTMVFSAACDAGSKLNGSTGSVPSLAAVLIVWATCIALHLAAMGIATAGGAALRFGREDNRAVAFAGSQKTLPIGLLLATDKTMFGGFPFAVFPMLMYHASQLFIDTLIADRMASGAGRESRAAASAGREAPSASEEGLKDSET